MCLDAGVFGHTYPRAAYVPPTPCRSSVWDLELQTGVARQRVGQTKVRRYQLAAFRELYLMVPEAARADKVAKPRFREVSNSAAQSRVGLEGMKLF